MASSEYLPNFTKNQRQWNKFFWLGFSISTEENLFVKNDTSAILDGLATIAKRSTGKISIRVSYKTELALDFGGSTLLLDVIDPTILGIVEQESNELGLFEKLKATKKETFKELKYLLHLHNHYFYFFLVILSMLIIMWNLT